MIAEDDAPLRLALSDLVAGEKGMEVVGAAGSADEAIELAAAAKPDVALVDVRLPGGGAELVRGVKECSPRTRALALSDYDDRSTVIQMFSAGAVGYVVKGNSPTEILEAVRRAARGQASLSIDATSRMIEELVGDMAERAGADAILRRSEERFHGLVELAPDGVVIVGEDGAMQLVNSQTERLFGYTRDELLGLPIEHLLPKRFYERQLGSAPGGVISDDAGTIGLVNETAVGRRKDGSEFPIHISLAAVETEQGRLATAFIRDISERRRGEIAARQLAAIVESSDDAIIGKDLDGTIQTWNLGAERMYGYSAEEVVGRSIALLVPPDTPDDLPGILDELRRGEETDQFETKRIRKDEVVLDVLLKISAIRDEDGQLVGTSSIARDVTSDKEQAELERERALLAHLVSAGEEERRRIASGIHDDSIQAITSAGMRLQILRRSLDDPVQLQLLGELEDTIQLSIRRLRHLLFELRPPALDSDGLSAAVELYLAEMQNAGTTNHRLENNLSVQPRLETRTILYRIVQELLANVRNHAQAGNATVVLEEREHSYGVRVSDDGVGFAPEKLEPVPGHLGLTAMRERAALAGGSLRIDSAPGQGTTVEVWIPELPLWGVSPAASPDGEALRKVEAV